MTTALDRNVTDDAATGKRVDRTAAARQARYRTAKALTVSAADEFFEAFLRACDRSGCARFADNLPEERAARVAEMIRRLDESRIVACSASTTRKKRKR